MIFGLTLSVTFVAMHNYEKMRHISLLILASLMVSNLVVQLTPCYSKESFHFKRVIIFVFMIVLCLTLTVFLRFKVASIQEIDQLYDKIF